MTPYLYQPLQKVSIKEEVPPHIAPRTDTHVNDTYRPMINDKYPWLDADDKRWHMADREITEWKVNLKDSSLTQEKSKSLQSGRGTSWCFYEIGTCTQVEGTFKIVWWSKVLCSLMLKKERKLFIQGDESSREISHNTEGINKVQFPSAFGKMKAAKLYRVCSNFQVLNDKLQKI